MHVISRFPGELPIHQAPKTLSSSKIRYVIWQNLLNLAYPHIVPKSIISRLYSTPNKSKHLLLGVPWWNYYSLWNKTILIIHPRNGIALINVIVNLEDSQIIHREQYLFLFWECPTKNSNAIVHSVCQTANNYLCPLFSLLGRFSSSFSNTNQMSPILRGKLLTG